MKRILLFSHAQHLEILKKIKPFTKYVEIATPYRDGDDEELIVALRPFLIETKKTKEWTGTRTWSEMATSLYRYNCNDELFRILSEYESFFISVNIQKISNYVKQICGAVNVGYWQAYGTSFGDIDIAFFDENNEELFSTTTHEGIAIINEKFELDNEDLYTPH